MATDSINRAISHRLDMLVEFFSGRFQASRAVLRLSMPDVDSDEVVDVGSTGNIGSSTTISGQRAHDFSVGSCTAPSFGE